MYKSFIIGSRFRVIPPGITSSLDGHIDLVMKRGAFGSGEHETTESCLEILLELSDIKAARVLDLGSGSGILAIAAIKIGARHVVCVDIEPKAVETARINCSLNHVDHQVTHVTGTLDTMKDVGFDIIMANIYGDILLDLATPLTDKLKPGGKLLLSGILWEYNYDVRRAYERRGCAVLKNRMLNEFSSVLMQKL
jgi:ribosomal protein L11 methyltransferase